MVKIIVAIFAVGTSKSLFLVKFEPSTQSFFYIGSSCWYHNNFFYINSSCFEYMIFRLNTMHHFLLMVDRHKNSIGIGHKFNFIKFYRKKKCVKFKISIEKKPSFFFIFAVEFSSLMISEKKNWSKTFRSIFKFKKHLSVKMKYFVQFSYSFFYTDNVLWG